MKATRLIGAAVLDRDKAEILSRAYYEVWASIARDYADDPDVIESVRLELATIMLALSLGDQRDAEALKRSAIRLLRNDY